MNLYDLTLGQIEELKNIFSAETVSNINNDMTQKDSFIFYRSFYEAISALNDAEKLSIFNAICELGLNQELTELEPLPNAMFTLIKPQLEANNKRYENGKKGGKPKTKSKPKANQKLTKAKPNKNVNGNVNVNVNKNDNVNNKYIFSGKIINLTEKDFNTWQETYKNIDLNTWLSTYDSFLQSLPPEKQKNWFFMTANYLAKKNEEFKSDDPTHAEQKDLERRAKALKERKAAREAEKRKQWGLDR